MPCRFHEAAWICFMSLRGWSNLHFHIIVLHFHSLTVIPLRCSYMLLLCNICGKQKLMLLVFLPLYFPCCFIFSSLQSISYHASSFCRCGNDSFKWIILFSYKFLIKVYHFTVFISLVNMYHTLYYLLLCNYYSIIFILYTFKFLLTSSEARSM